MGKIYSLEALGLVSDGENVRLDSITRLAASILDAPISIATMIQKNHDRQFFTASTGLPDELLATRQTPLDVSICRHVTENGSLLTIPDLKDDLRTADNPLVREHGLRSYIGTPIHSVSGQPIGALCCIKTEVYTWTDAQITLLTQLASCVDDLIQLNTIKLKEQNANRKLRAIAGARSSFIAHISHEIRTPLTGIIGSIRLLKRFKLEGTPGALINLLDRSSLRLLDVVNDTLDLSRIDAGSFRIAQQECDLELISANVVENHSAQASLKSVTVGVSSSLNGKIYLGDCKVLESVLDNLFGNAVKFTNAGSADIRLSNDSYGNVMIQIVDTGAGIPMALQLALFDEFEKAGPKIARKYGGTGLGMAMVKRLVELMDGEIDLVSEPDHGTTITIVLPLEFVDPTASRVPEPAPCT